MTPTDSGIDPTMNVVNIMTTAELGALRRAYEESPNELALSARKQVISPYPDAAMAVSCLGDRFFFPINNATLPINESDRERCIISVLVAADIDPGYVLAVHLYWGICAGLSPKEIADIVLLSSLYSGIPHWAVNIHRFRALLLLLKKVVAAAMAKAGKDEKRLLKELSPDKVSAIVRQQFTFATLEQISKLQTTVAELTDGPDAPAKLASVPAVGRARRSGRA